MEQLILGTAGHIDHGKSSLVRMVTGVDPDRLKEEKARGITIELGFASLQLPDGRLLGIVDVPGHEKFVKNMVAGAAGIDIVAMIIAADEGVMPQTREHMEICTLLGITSGLVVLTKIDLVDEELLELVTEDIRDFTRGTFLEESPLVSVSTVTGEGLENFAPTVAKVAAHIPQRSQTGFFRLPVDRVFSMKGFGTVITGTLVSGRVRTGDTVSIYPAGTKAKVRGLQVHSRLVEQAMAGMRTAVNFQGMEKTEISRGDVLSGPGALVPSYMLDVHFQYLASNDKPLKNRTRVRVHSGTSDVPGYVILLDRNVLEPGDSALVQLRLEAPLVCVKDDRLVVRRYSPARTIGGGKVLNPVPPKHKRHRQSLTQSILALDDAPLEEVVLFHCGQAQARGISLAMLRVMTNTGEKQLEKALDSLLSSQRLVLADKDKRRYLHAEVLATVAETVSSTLMTFHEANPLKKGMPRQELKSKIEKQAGGRVFELAYNRLSKSGKLTQEGGLVRLSGHTVSLQADHSDLHRRIIDIFEESGLSPPLLKELKNTLQPRADDQDLKDVLQLLTAERKLVKVKEDLYFSATAIDRLATQLTDFLKQHQEITTPQLKEMTKTSRKYTIPLIEYFDAIKLTIRIGDVRKLRR
ncbi:MAG: selenocysteine-specific translation elongation factor [Desulfosudaceae bacterium]